MRTILLLLASFTFPCFAVAIADDRTPPYKTVGTTMGRYQLQLDTIRLTERQSHTYLITQEDEPPNFVDQVFGIRLENQDLPAEDFVRVAGKIHQAVVSIRILDVATAVPLYEYHGPIKGLYGTASVVVPKGGIRYSRFINNLHYHLDHYYTIFGVETSFRKKISQRIEFSVVEPMVQDHSFDGTVMVVIEGGIGK